MNRRLITATRSQGKTGYASTNIKDNIQACVSTRQRPLDGFKKNILRLLSAQRDYARLIYLHMQLYRIVQWLRSGYGIVQIAVSSLPLLRVASPLPLRRCSCTGGFWSNSASDKLQQHLAKGISEGRESPTRRVYAPLSVEQVWRHDPYQHLVVGIDQAVAARLI